MENRIKECQMDLFADRTSTSTMRANQLRLWCGLPIPLCIVSLRRIALQATDLADASCGTIRRKLFKIAPSSVSASGASNSLWRRTVPTRPPLLLQ